jgi:hypothetical protein
MHRMPTILILQASAVMLGLVSQPQILRAQERLPGGPQHSVSVKTNQGRLTEYYGTPGNSAVIEYDQLTNDIPMLQALSTNLNGRVFHCLLMASQLKAAPKWDPEKTAPPLSPRQARLIAVEQAFKDLGPSMYNAFDFEASHHWSVVDLDLVQSWGWWDRDFVWYYRVGVKRHVAGSTPGTPDAQIFITMDGKAASYIQRKNVGTGQR